MYQIQINTKNEKSHSSPPLHKQKLHVACQNDISILSTDLQTKFFEIVHACFLVVTPSGNKHSVMHKKIQRTVFDEGRDGGSQIILHT